MKYIYICQINSLFKIRNKEIAGYIHLLREDVEDEILLCAPECLVDPEWCSEASHYWSVQVLTLLEHLGYGCQCYISQCRDGERPITPYVHEDPTKEY